MKHSSMTDQKLLEEISVLKQRIKDLELSEIEHRHDEEALRKERDFGAALVEASPAFFVAMDENGTIELMNGSMLDALGYTLEEVMGKDCLSMLVPDWDKEALSEIFVKLITETVQTINENRVLTKDGRELLVEWHGRAVRKPDGNLDYFFGVGTDITERRRAEEALRESEKKFKDLAEKSIAGIYLIQDGIFKYVNLKLAQILGYEIDEITGKMFVKDVIFPEDWPAVEENMRKRIEGELGSLHYEFRVVTKNKEVKNAEVYSSRTIYRGKPTIIGTYLDITERKQIENALRESEARWQFALEGSGDGVWDWDAASNHVFFSARWKAMLGYAEQEIGNTLDEWDRRVHPDDKAGVYADLERHFRHETAHYENEHRVLCKDGSYKWILDRGKVIEWAQDGRPTRMIGTHTDITDRKQAETALLESEARLRSITGSARDGIIMMDPRGAISYWNPAAEEMLGYCQDEAIGKNLHELLAPERYLEAHRSAFPGFMRTGQGNAIGKTLELAARRKDGREIPVDLSLSVVSLHGEPYAVGILRDITSRKRAEEEEKHSEKLSAALEMAGAICHELNQPLQVISGRIDLLSMESKDDRIRKTLEIISDQVSRIGAITKKLMGLRKYSNRAYAGTMKIANIDQTPEGGAQ